MRKASVSDPFPPLACDCCYRVSWVRYALMRVPTIYIQVFGVVAILASLALHYTSHYSLQIVADLVVLAFLIIMLVRNAEGRARQ